MNIPYKIVRGIILTESNGNQYAWKVEPPYRYLVNVSTRQPFRTLTTEEIDSEKAPKDFPYLHNISSRDTEWWGQQSSWGLMQVMGAVAREYGFKGAFPELCSDVGSEYGEMHLSKLADRFLMSSGWDGVVAAYNAGSPRKKDGAYVNQIYVNQVQTNGEFSWSEFV